MPKLTVSQKYFTFSLVAAVALDILGATLKAFLLTLLTAAAVGSCTSVAAAQSPLRKVGECVDTQIAEIGSRLQGAPDSGTTISYANGVYGVSYDIEPAIRKSRVGDPITLCLSSVPKGCPKGDDRGKIYRAINIRTRARWELPDSQHMCGGA